MITNRSSRAGPPLIPPSPTMMERSARSFMSMVRGQVMRRVSSLERVAVMQMRVEHRGEKIVRAGNRMEVAREMQVDVLHRDHLRIPAPAAPPSRRTPDPATARGCREWRPDAEASGVPASAPTVTVDFPSPPAVGLMPVTRISLPLGFRLLMARQLKFSLCISRRAPPRRRRAPARGRCRRRDASWRPARWRCPTEPPPLAPLRSNQGDGVTRAPNTRVALAVSVGTRASRETPRARASASAMFRRTKAGSLRLPRMGHRRQVRRVGLHQQAVRGTPRQILRVPPALERDHPAE